MGVYTSKQTPHKRPFRNETCCAHGSWTDFSPTVLTYVGVTAREIGIDPGFCFYLISIANASSLLGRYVAGNTCDSAGQFYLLVYVGRVCIRLRTLYLHRRDERDDPAHGIRWDSHLCMALRSHKSVIDHSRRVVWVRTS